MLKIDDSPNLQSVTEARYKFLFIQKNLRKNFLHYIPTEDENRILVNRHAKKIRT